MPGTHMLRFWGVWSAQSSFLFRSHGEKHLEDGSTFLKHIFLQITHWTLRHVLRPCAPLQPHSFLPPPCPGRLSGLSSRDATLPSASFLPSRCACETLRSLRWRL